ncbi:MAG: ABC transporter ATP-binding protein [Verrucomicrobiota bacterium]
MTKSNQSSKATNEKSPLAAQLVGVRKLFKLRWKRAGRQVVALENLDLQIRQGEVLGLLGPNGSGKSTTMKLLLGLTKATEGEVRVWGHPAGSVAAKIEIGFLPENPYFPNFLTGEELLQYYGKLGGLHGKHLNQKINYLLALIELEYAAKRVVKNYSKGMLQRIGIAQALLHDPKLLLLDEPTAGVDPIGAKRIRDLILRLKEDGKTIIFSSHILEQVEDVADHVVILERGKKLAEGSLAEMLEDRNQHQITFQGLDADAIKQITHTLENKGAKNITISRTRQNLEDLFVDLVKKDSKS